MPFLEESRLTRRGGDRKREVKRFLKLFDIYIILMLNLENFLILPLMREIL